MAGVPWPLDETWQGPRLPLPSGAAPEDLGIAYAMLFDDYHEHFKDDDNQVSANLLFRWIDANDARQQLVGFTTWDGISTYLQRSLPLLCPFYENLFCKEVQSIGIGCMPDRTSMDAGAGASHWLAADWIKYRATFRRPPYVIEPDDDGYSAGTRSEIFRYTTTKWHFTSREQKLPAQQLKTWPANNSINEAAFLSRYRIVFAITWHQVPVDALPTTSIRDNLNRVNTASIDIPLGTPGGDIILTCLPESLLFKGLYNDLVPYGGADGGLYFDPTYHFEYEPTFDFNKADTYPNSRFNWFGWNGFYDPGTSTRPPVWTWLALPSQTDVNPGGPTTPPNPPDKDKTPYLLADHSQLFVPGG